MNKRIALLFAFLLASSITAHSANITIGAGGELGEYTNTIVPAIDKALRSSSDHTASAKISAGSQENLYNLLDGEIDVALIQLDVLAMNEAVQGGHFLEVLGLIAPEALLCAAREGGKIRSYYNLTDKYAEPIVISAGDEASGTARTLQFLIDLDPDIDDSKITFVHESNTVAELDRLAAGNRDMACFMMMPNPKNELLEKVADSDDLFFIDFVSILALEVEANEQSIYEPMVVPVSKGVWGVGADKIETLTTWAALVAHRDTDPAITDALRVALADPELLPPTTAAGKAKQLFGDFKSKAKDLTGKAKEKASDWTAKAKVKATELKEKTQEKASELKEKAGELTEKAKEKAGEMAEKAGELTEKAKDKALELKQKAADMTTDQNNN